MIADWADMRGYSLGFTRFFEPLHKQPNLDVTDMLVIMGGPMRVHDEAQYPWIIGEKALIKEFIKAGKHVIGICLGAQLVADVLGAPVYTNPVKEIGWFPVAVVDDAVGQPVLSGLNLTMNVLHWHSDTFDLPLGATLLMSSEACKNQAFIYKEKVLGLQFHLEMTEEGIRGIIANGKAEIIPSGTVQSEHELLAGVTAIPACKYALFSLMDHVATSGAQIVKHRHSMSLVLSVSQQQYTSFHFDPSSCGGDSRE